MSNVGLPQSTQVLIAALEAKNDPRLVSVIENAKNNKYHNYLSPPNSSGKELLDDLTDISMTDFGDILNCWINGDFDIVESEEVVSQKTAKQLASRMFKNYENRWKDFE